MDIDYVDYYGKYEDLDDNDFTFSVTDIHQKQRQKDLRRLHVYKSILGKVYKKIKSSASNEESYCFYEVPEYIYGTPLYNMRDCVVFVLNNLHEKGFSAKYVDPYLIFVCWNLPKPNLKITDIPKLMDLPPKQNMIDVSPPVYRPIENFQGAGNYLYNQQKKESPPQITNYSYNDTMTNRESSNFNRMMAVTPSFSRPQYQPQQNFAQSQSPADRNMLFSSFSNKPAFNLGNRFN